MLGLPNRLSASILMTILLLIFLASLPLIFLCIAVRTAVRLLALLLRPDCENFVGGSDSIFAMYDGTRAVTNITTVLITKGRISSERLHQMYRERIQNIEFKTGQPYFKRLHQFWTTFLGYPFWKTDEDFRVENHIRDYDYGGELRLNPECCTEEDLQRVFGKLSQVQWRPGRSPWELLVVSNYVGNSNFKSAENFGAFSAHEQSPNGLNSKTNAGGGGESINKFNFTTDGGNFNSTNHADSKNSTNHVDSKNSTNHAVSKHSANHADAKHSTKPIVVGNLNSRNYKDSNQMTKNGGNVNNENSTNDAGILNCESTTEKSTNCSSQLNYEIDRKIPNIFNDKSLARHTKSLHCKSNLENNNSSKTNSTILNCDTGKSSNLNIENPNLNSETINIDDLKNIKNKNAITSTNLNGGNSSNLNSENPPNLNNKNNKHTKFTNSKPENSVEFLNYKNTKNSKDLEPKTVLILRLDHVICDAYSIVLFLRSLFKSPMKCSTGNLNERSLSLREWSSTIFKVAYDLADLCLNELDRSQLRSPVITKVKGVSCGISGSVEVELIKSIKNHYKVSYAAVIYSIIYGALQTTLENNNENVPKNLASFIILPKPDRPDKFVNHLYGTCSKISCSNSTAEERLQEIYKKLLKARTSSTPFAIDFLGSLIQYVPVVFRKFFSHKIHLFPLGVSVGCTVFPALTGVDFFDGCEVTDLFFGLGPSLNIGIFVAVWGTNNQQKFVFIVDKTMIKSEKVIQSFGINVQQQVELLASGIPSGQVSANDKPVVDDVEITVL